MKTYFIGIDIGTQGARVALLDEAGSQVASREETFSLHDGWREEQDPELWWASCLRLLQQLCNQVRNAIPVQQVKAMAVTSTSGTIIPLGRDGQPLHTAIMYSDPRSAGEAKLCCEAAAAAGYTGYTGFNSSSGLPKMLWFLNTWPEKAGQLVRFVHAADFITGRLSGNYAVSDYTNALKSGFDVRTGQWPEYIFKMFPLTKSWMQEVFPSGTVIGPLLPALAQQLGLSKDVVVTTGMTDGCASQVASGAVHPGNWNTTIGTTMVVKGVTKAAITDPTGALYSHRHPDGYWMPGGASNTGADWVSKYYATEDLPALEKKAAACLPTGQSAWPLLQRGERFPVVAPTAAGFAPDNLDKATLFAARMEGVAYMERLAYERIRELSGEKVEQVFSAGGASNSNTWLRIRATVLNVPVCKMLHVSGAAGAAIVAASRTHFHSLTEAAGAMTHADKWIEPEKDWLQAYEAGYHQFIELLQQKGYLSSSYA